MDKKICKKCGTENSSEEVFCTNCGELLITSDDFKDKENNKAEDTVTTKDKDVLTQDNKKNENNKKTMGKKGKVIILVTVCVMIICAVLSVVFLGGGSLFGPSTPDKAQITADLNKDKAITTVKVGKHNYEFKVSHLSANTDKASTQKESYTVDTTFSRVSDIYGIDDMTYTVTYTKDNGAYTYNKAVLKGSDEMSFSALAGYPKDYADKVMAKYYEDATFSKQTTDLEKGVDKIAYTVDNDEFSGTATLIYKFSNTVGWEFSKLDDKVDFKKGTTHKNNGLYENSNIKNIMLFGRDSDGSVGRSDSMMLITVDSNTGTIKQTSFMRDTYVNIPGYGYNKLNAAYAFGGAKLAIKTFESIYGIKIDNYVTGTFKSVKKIVSVIGGIDVDITSDEAGYINWQLNHNNQTYAGLISTKGGVTHLNGHQTLWLCRDRGGNGFSGTDFTRTARQRRVIRALISKYKSSSPAKMLSAINGVKAYVETDLTKSDFLWYAERCTRFFKYNTAEKCVPDDGEWTADYTDGGAWIISMNNWNKSIKDVQEFVFEDLKN